MCFKAAILKNRILSFRAAVLVAAIMALSIGSGAAQEKYKLTAEEIRAGSVWASKTNRVLQEFGEVINLTTQLDEISEGVLYGEIKRDFASRQFKNMLSNILLKYNNARDAVKRLGSPPTFQDERIQRRFGGSYEMLGLAEKSAKKMIKESSLLFVEAKTGNKDATIKLFEKSIRTFSSVLELQNAVLSGQAATYGSDEANYYHYKGMVETYSAMIFGLNAILPVFKSGSVDIEMIETAHVNLKVSKNTYIIGRRILKKNINKYSAMKASSLKDKNNKQILLKALRSIYESFDIEEELIIIVEKFLNEIRKNIHKFDPEYLDNISIKGNILENKRQEVMIYRQDIIRDIK